MSPPPGIPGAAPSSGAMPPPGIAPPQKKRGCSGSGCVLGCLTVFVVIPILVLVAGYFVVMYTSLPLKGFETALSSDPNITVTGFDGSLAKGIKLEELRVASPNGDSYMSDFQFELGSSSIRTFFSNELHIKRFHIGFVRIIVPPPSFDEESFDDGTYEYEVSSDSSGPDVSAFEDLPVSRENLTSIRIDEFTIDSVEVIFPDGSVRRARLKVMGLEFANGEFGVDEVEISSDFLTMQLLTAPEDTPYHKQLLGRILAADNPMLLRDADFHIFFEPRDAAGNVGTGLVAFNGAVAGVTYKDETWELKTKAFSLSDYIQPIFFSLPDQANLDIEGTRSVATVRSGNFMLGPLRFTVPSQELDAEDPSQALLATGVVPGRNIDLELHLPQAFGSFAYEFRGDPPFQSHLEALSWVFFGRGMEQLTPEERMKLNQLQLTYPEPLPEDGEGVMTPDMMPPIPAPGIPAPVPPTQNPAQGQAFPPPPAAPPSLPQPSSTPDP